MQPLPALVLFLNKFTFATGRGLFAHWRNIMTKSVSVLALVLLTYGSLAHAQWGDLKARFVVKGDAAKPVKLNVAKEPFCVKHSDLLVDEGLIVSADGGLQNVVVSLYAGDDKVPVHESYKEAATGEVIVDNNKCRFEPHIATMRTTQTLVIKNSDPMGHNAKIDLFNNTGVNPLIPPGQSVKLSFKSAETRPMPMSCSIHPWMSGHILIKEDPYVGVSDANGNVEIKNIPKGEWTFVIWHERPAYVTSATVNGKSETWKKGRATFEIKDKGVTDLGDVVLTVDQLKQK